MPATYQVDPGRTEARWEAYLHSSADGGLRRRATRGAAVTVGGQWGRFVVQIGSTMVLARLLSPDDYGLIGMVLALTGIAELLKDLGLSAATIQRRDLSHRQVSLLFWVNAATGAALMLIVIAVAPIIAGFYGRSELGPITVGLSAMFAAGGLTVQHQALLSRRMDYGKLATVEVSAMVVAAAGAILAALLGAGFWALVVFHVGMAVTRAILVWVLCPWRPSRPQRAEDIGKIASFGGNLSVFNFLNYLARHADNILIGRYVGASALGLYSKAYQLLLLPLNQINAPLSTVAIPTLSRLQDQPERYRRYYRTAIGAIALFAMPLIVLLAALSEELIEILLGAQWLDAAGIFKVLAFAGIAQSVAHANGWLYVSMGRTGRQAAWALVSRPLIVIAFVVGLPWGAYGVAVSYTICQYLLLLPAFMLAVRDSPVRLSDVADAAWRPFVLSSVMFTVATFAHGQLAASGLVARGAGTALVALTVFLALAAPWPRVRRDALALRAMVTGAFSKETAGAGSNA